jgi:hypothetical protein
MKLARWMPPPKDAPALSPPITTDEERWWMQKRKSLRAYVVLRWGVPQFLVFTMAAVYQHPEKLLDASMLWLVPAMGLMAVLSSLGMWKSSEKAQRDQEVRWKRIRESLLEESTKEQ